MKTKLLIAVLLIMTMFTLVAQDVIVKKSGEVLNVYNVEVASKYIFYTTEQSSDDIKKLAKEDVFSVKIGDSEMQMVSEIAKEAPQITKQAESEDGQIERKVADNNAELIARYNKRYGGITDKEPIDKMEKDGCAILGVTKESVLSNEDIEVELRMVEERLGKLEWIGNEYCMCYLFKVFINNKTERTIYVDLGNTFKIYNSGNTKVYFDGSQVSQNQGGGSGASINLGAVTSALGVGGITGTLASGIGIGGGTQSSASKTYGSQRILAIPPKGKVCLPPNYEIDGKNIKEIYDNIDIRYPSKIMGVMKKYAITDIDEKETLWKNHYVVKYSTDLSFKTYSIIKFSLYLKQLIGSSRRMGWNYKKMCEQIIDFDEYTLIGAFLMDEKIQDILDVKLYQKVGLSKPVFY